MQFALLRRELVLQSQERLLDFGRKHISFFDNSLYIEIFIDFFNNIPLFICIHFFCDNVLLGLLDIFDLKRTEFMYCIWASQGPMKRVCPTQEEKSEG